jgi:hypothetical protein
MLRLLSLLLMSFAATAAAAQPRSPAFTSDRISVEVHGQGPDVVLIPGLNSSPRVWEGWVGVESPPALRSSTNTTPPIEGR